MVSRHPMRLRAALLLLCLLAFWAPATALAHAALVTIDPADKSSGPAPSEILGTFAQNLDPAKSSFAVVDASGTIVAQGGQVTAGNPREMTLALPALEPGAYTIRWTTSSTEDGELARGTTRFTVMAAPSVTPASSASGPTASAAPPSAAPSLAPTPSPESSPSPTGGQVSSGDIVIPIVAALVALAALGLWLLRERRSGNR